MKQNTANILSVWISLFGMCCRSAWADGGTVRLVERQGDYQISVFTSPNPLRAGPIDVSVLSQYAKTGDPVENATVQIRLTPRGRLEETIDVVATNAAATNKVLRAAAFELPTPGWWDVEVNCVADHGAVQVNFAMEAGRPLPPWLTVWPWFGWPLAIVLLFGVHRWLVARREAKATPPLTTPGSIA